MKILAIETSCDDTCAAVAENDRILSNIISSQIDLHAKWGGVVPDIAKRAHLAQIDPVISEALKRARTTIEEIDVIAVTQGPGLAVALGVGIEKAKELAKLYNKKMVAVNHIEGHMMSNWIKNSKGKPTRKIEFPALALTASGGHTKIILINDLGKYTVVGETLDDAAGEALDKAAKLLGLGYPGGPVIEKLAQRGNDKYLPLPRPMANKNNFDFSYSGLKTSFYYQVRKWPTDKIQENIFNLAASFQTAVFEMLIRKFKYGAIKYQPKTLLGSGGLMANMTLKKELRKMAKNLMIPIYFPFKGEFNTDNAAMIAIAGYYKAMRGEYVKDIEKLDREARMKI